MEFEGFIKVLVFGIAEDDIECPNNLVFDKPVLSFSEGLDCKYFTDDNYAVL